MGSGLLWAEPLGNRDEIALWPAVSSDVPLAGYKSMWRFLLLDGAGKIWARSIS